jgi:hypothetical protein
MKIYLTPPPLWVGPISVSHNRLTQVQKLAIDGKLPLGTPISAFASHSSKRSKPCQHFMSNMHYVNLSECNNFLVIPPYLGPRDPDIAFSKTAISFPETFHQLALI